MPSQIPTEPEVSVNSVQFEPLPVMWPKWVALPAPTNPIVKALAPHRCSTGTTATVKPPDIGRRSAAKADIGSHRAAMSATTVGRAIDLHISRFPPGRPADGQPFDGLDIRSPLRR